MKWTKVDNCEVDKSGQFEVEVDNSKWTKVDNCEVDKSGQL